MSMQNCHRASKLSVRMACILVVTVGVQDVVAAEALRTARSPAPLLHGGRFARPSLIASVRRTAHIWANMIKSADWCAKQVPRTEWIPTAASDPQFENLYDRFYAAMHDAAIVEHLAFTVGTFAT